MANSLKYDIAKMLATERQMKKMTQEEIAEKLGTKKSNVSRFEKGDQNVGVDYIEAFSKALGMNSSFVMEEVSEYIVSEHTDYSLCLYDEELLSFSLRKSTELSCEILSVNKRKKKLLPLDLELSSDGLLSWLDRRIIPSNRAFVGEILTSLGLERTDIKGIIDICKGLSLNDSYWIIPKGSSLKFDDYNLFENDFSDILSLVAYTGRPFSSKKIVSSPELTTNGVLRKAWRNKAEKGIWLYKAGTSDFANAGNEPFSEYYAAQIAKAMGLHHVSYELENWKGILASKCELFTSKDLSFVPIGSIVKEKSIEAVLELYKRLGDAYYQELCSMLVFDVLIYNEDRHFGNFGLLRDNKTGDFVGPAPIFDNGNSLLCYAMKDDFNDIKTYIAGRSTPYGKGFDELLPKVLGRKQKAQLRKLIGFKFSESDICNLPSWRIKALEEILEDRIRYMLQY